MLCERRNEVFQCDRRMKCLGRLVGSTVAQAVKDNSRNNDHAGDDFLNPIREIHLGAPIRHHRHDQGTNERPKDRALPTVKACAANDDRGNDQELHAICCYLDPVESERTYAAHRARSRRSRPRHRSTPTARIC